MSKVPMTKGGLDRIKEELKRLKTVDRGKIVKEIEVARAHGDISENAEYHAAKERQGQIEARIRQLDDMIARAEVIDISKLKGDRVMFGATVELSDTDSDAKVTYRIVGEVEADAKKGLISITSPIARALVGKSIGDDVTVQAPGGARDYEILAVKFVDDL
jgi:transcription elongation factor GreA